MTGTDTGYAMTIMPNNLHKMITSSGLSKREVAALKGVTPETLSRHISGKIGISLDDAEQYARYWAAQRKRFSLQANRSTLSAPM